MNIMVITLISAIFIALGEPIINIGYGGYINYYVRMLLVLGVGFYLIYRHYFSKGICVHQRRKLQQALLAVSGITIISIMFYCIPLNYPSHWRDATRYGRDNLKTIVVFIIGCLSVAVAYKILHKYLMAIEGDMKLIIHYISYPYRVLVVADILAIVIFISISIYPMDDLQISAWPPLIGSYLSLMFETGDVGEMILIASLFGMGLQLLVVYMLLEKLIQLKVKGRLMLELIIPTMVILIYGILSGAWGIGCILNGRREEVEPGILAYIQAGVLEYILIGVWGVVIIGFLISSVRLYRRKAIS